jgi:hypothetical protein
MVQHRISKLEEKLKGGNILPKKVVGTNDPKVKSMRGAINVYKFLKNIYDTRGDKDEILDELKYLDFEENYQYGKHKITRKSEQLFEIQK